jgi:hypothetical protein
VFVSTIISIPYKLWCNVCATVRIKRVSIKPNKTKVGSTAYIQTGGGGGGGGRGGGRGGGGLARLDADKNPQIQLLV